MPGWAATRSRLCRLVKAAVFYACLCAPKPLSARNCQLTKRALVVYSRRAIASKQHFALCSFARLSRGLVFIEAILRDPLLILTIDWTGISTFSPCAISSECQQKQGRYMFHTEFHDAQRRGSDAAEQSEGAQSAQLFGWSFCSPLLGRRVTGSSLEGSMCSCLVALPH
jgi:hypothetical protein